MPTHKPTRVGQTFTVAAGDEIDLGNEFYVVWFQHQAVGGSDISVAPGEGRAGDRRYGLVTNAGQDEYIKVAPDFPTRYLLIAAAGDVWVHWANAVRRSM